jgi:hypothetical protein
VRPSKRGIFGGNDKLTIKLIDGFSEIFPLASYNLGDAQDVAHRIKNLLDP